MTEEISLTGTVKAWTFQNPHSWLLLDVTGPDGNVTEWSIESAPPGYMARQGWSAESLERGEPVTILVSPLRSASEPHRGILLEIETADGETLIVRPRGRYGRPAAAAAYSGGPNDDVHDGGFGARRSLQGANR